MRKFLHSLAAMTFVASLAACGRAPPAPEQAAAPAVAANPTWFICDAIDAPALLLFTGSLETQRARLVRYDKATGAPDLPIELTLGPADGAAGSVYTPLLRDGAEAGAVRQINPGMLQTPGAAYTTPFSSLVFEQQTFTCRWLPRTRLMGFTGRRSFVIHEDADGDLIYTTFDFANASTTPIELSENGRSTPFSVEVRGGEESVTPEGAEFRFTANGYTYVVVAPRTGEARIDVLRGDTVTQTEPLIAFTPGSASDVAAP